MTKGTWNVDLALAELGKLFASGVVGFFNDFEITEVFAIPVGSTSVVNVFTIAVAVENGSGSAKRASSTYLNGQKPIHLKSIGGWKFGVKRYIKGLADLRVALQVLTTKGDWALSGDGDLLKFGKVAPQIPVFVPPDSSQPVPLNRVLKNNFWNGCHVLEWLDAEKTALQPLFAQPESLQELAAKVSKWVPLGLASLSDRLGNLIVQIPVTVFMTRFTKSRTNDGLVAELVWHVRATPRPLRASCRVESDHVLTGYVSAPVAEPQTPLTMPFTQGGPTAVVWDEVNNIVLAATEPMHFINSVVFNLLPKDPEPREFNVLQGDGSRKPIRVDLLNQGIEGHAGAPPVAPGGGWTHRRIYDEELARLEKDRTFVQYFFWSDDKQAERIRALNDVRSLINSHGRQGAWLWDPYLSADDILETLVYCIHSGSDLRALTAGREPPGAAAGAVSGATGAGIQGYIAAQKKKLDDTPSNWRGLTLEYRVKHGQAGLPFHDRFLIFPQKDGTALAWSLGTSVNQLGTAHHILQKVTNPRLIMEAFVKLWNELDKPEHLIWKKP